MVRKELTIYKYIENPYILTAFKCYNDKKYKKLFLLYELMDGEISAFDNEKVFFDNKLFIDENSIQMNDMKIRKIVREILLSIK